MILADNLYGVAEDAEVAGSNARHSWSRSMGKPEVGTAVPVDLAPASHRVVSREIHQPFVTFTFWETMPRVRTISQTLTGLGAVRFRQALCVVAILLPDLSTG